MNITPHSYAESFIAEDAIKAVARARGLELGALDVTQGTGAYLRHLAHQLSAQSVVEIGTGSGVGALWLLEGMMASGTLTSIDDEMEHTNIAKMALAEADIAQPRFRLITNSVMDVMTKLTDRAYDLVVFRHNPEDLSFAISEAHRILRSGGVFVIDNFFGGSKVQDPAQRDPKTIALREAGKSIKLDTEAWVTTLIPTGDGLLLATKL
ncbi:methyltransferase [Candidatus Planktophila sulfonica]|jgi:predicted O-methyltransferase YrrM|uniref:Methyltransferase n=1 Tax=Candidatus Planktophila sulfonica TaxID=1884904 RepID=A0A249KHU2_9ACTN|nr:class I SAM-dependent methyltransferase [Candidatus Planktophila sulfonica]ASY16265.1 methyltransferase [Candidatus Planktophila sulfonica]